jgi:hypothetical protein
MRFYPRDRFFSMVSGRVWTVGTATRVYVVMVADDGDTWTLHNVELRERIASGYMERCGAAAGFSSAVELRQQYRNGGRVEDGPPEGVEFHRGRRATERGSVQRGA